MKKFILLPALLFGLFTTIYAQDSLPIKHRIYKSTVTIENTKSVNKGYLASISDSSIFISPTSIAFGGSRTSNVNYKKIDYSSLAEVRLRRKGSTGRGILIGIISGAVTGGFLGYLDGNDPECTPSAPNDPWGIGYLFCNAFRATAGEKAAGGALVFCVGGGIVGAIVGAIAHKKFTIGGNKDRFHSMRENLLKRVTKRANKSNIIE